MPELTLEERLQQDKEHDKQRETGKFWMIFVMGGSSPSKVHYTELAANEEGARLARETKKVVYILKPSAILEVEPAPVKNTPVV
jgi:hypothetical protein